MEKSKHSCVSCGNEFHGRFCNVCGEKILEDSERTVFHFILVIFHEVTELDSKLWHTLKTVIFRPGQLSADYAIGKRNRYMRPITLFFLGNLIYFLFPIADTFNTLLQYQLNMPYTELANIPERVERAIAASGFEKEAFYLAYNTATSANSKLLLILLVPLTVPLLALVGWSRRKLFAEHLMFSLEFSLFLLYVTTILLGYLVFLVQFGLSVFGLPSFPFGDVHLTTMAVILLTYFLARGIRTFYGYTWFTSGLLTLLVVMGFYFSLSAYRWLLFEVTIAGM